MEPLESRGRTRSRASRDDIRRAVGAERDLRLRASRLVALPRGLSEFVNAHDPGLPIALGWAEPPVEPAELRGPFPAVDRVAAGVRGHGRADIASLTFGSSGTQEDGPQRDRDDGVGLPNDFAAPPKPLCPPGYQFDYEFQSCWSGPHRRPKPGERWKHACKCAPGESYLAIERECWRRGALPGGSSVHGRELVADVSRTCGGNFQPACESEFEESETWIKYDFCTRGEQLKLKAAAAQARRVASSAARFLANIATLPEDQIEFYWNFADLGGAAVIVDVAWRRSPAPSYWFGPYEPERLARAQHVAQLVSDRLRHGFSYLNWTTWPLHIRCANNCSGQSVIALHWAEGFVKLCPRVWTLFDSPNGFLDRPGGSDGLAMVLFHELCHRSGLLPLLRDAGSYGPIPARSLVLDGEFDTAFRNIENYVYWAFARYAWFGKCVFWDPSDHAYSCSGGGDQFGPYPEVCCHRCLGEKGGFWGDCRES
ncbi:MAG: hypothetical protein IPH07_39050 [Deltaproteobacteria bacterium]|nr:hypothetical protein [Deltaproteobacteria bacterium]MBK8713830.1 hypothetical protein [Deltaproteobacteria bacterium]MBP7291329.1 hypothetical protein [Nannocystaceae bacterium]